MKPYKNKILDTLRDVVRGLIIQENRIKNVLPVTARRELIQLSKSIDEYQWVQLLAINSKPEDTHVPIRNALKSPHDVI